MLIKKILFSAAFILAATGLKAQIIVKLTENDAVAKAVKNSRNASAAFLSIQEQKQLLKSAVNIPNPELTWQSPSGLFYVGGITQTLDFPTVYAKQYQLQKQQVGLAETQKVFTDVQIGYEVRSLYLNIQYADSLKSQLFIQDTIYKKLASSAQRQFDAGQIDFLQKTFAETQYGEVHNQFEQARLSYSSYINQLKYITGLNDSIVIEPLQAYSLDLSTAMYGKDSTLLNRNAELLISKQTEAISQKNLELQRNRALPGLAFGYMNQSDRNTPTNLRFQFGVTVPLWFWQYKGNINAAQTQLSVSQQKTAGLQQQLNVQLLQAQSDLAINYQALDYYQTTGLKKSNDIISASQRFLNSGESDYVSFLRSINDAYAIKLRYLGALKNWNQNIITINYLTGKQ